MSKVMHGVRADFKRKNKRAILIRMADPATGLDQKKLLIRIMKGPINEWPLMRKSNRTRPKSIDMFENLKTCLKMILEKLQMWHGFCLGCHPLDPGTVGHRFVDNYCKLWSETTEIVQFLFVFFIHIWQGCLVSIFLIAWWRHQMETFSALLALCAGNSPVTGEFPAQRPVTRSFDLPE